MVYNTQDYIQMLYDLEAGLYKDPMVTYHSISRDKDRILNVYIRFKECIDKQYLSQLIDRAKLLGRLAIDVQRFPGVKILIKEDQQDSVLESIIVT